MRRTAQDKKVRHAVVGLGHIAQAAVLPAFHHARAKSQLSALVSGSRIKFSKLSAAYGVKHAYSYDQYDECLRSGTVDARYLALPNQLHKRYATAALRKGIHALCEKPLGLTASDCVTMIRAAEESGAKLMVAYRLHFDQANLNRIILGAIRASGRFAHRALAIYAAGSRRRHAVGPEGRRRTVLGLCRNRECHFPRWYVGTHNSRAGSHKVRSLSHSAIIVRF